MGIRKDSFTGFIIDGKQKYPFYAAKQIFHFIPEGFGIFANAIKREIHCEDQFMYGYTTDGFQIALYAGTDKKEITANYSLQPGIFFLSRANCHHYDMTTFEAVEFRGGTLNNLYENKVESTSFDEKRSVFIREYKQFIQNHHLELGDNKCNLNVFSIPSKSNPQIMDLCLRFEFDNELPLIYVKRIFHDISELCRLLTNRENVGFDSIELYKIDDKTQKWLGFAEGIAYYPYDLFTQKAFQKNVLLEHIEKQLPNIIGLIDEDKVRKPKYNFDFMPESDEDAYVISNDKIKNVCSSLECEMSFIKDWNSEKDSSLRVLLEDVKKVINNHRKSEIRLDDKTYENIFSSMSHWDMPSAVKMGILYEKHRTFMEYYEKKWHMQCGAEHINALVKYRNDVTHGRYRNLDSDIVGTAFILMALSYCCFWERMGLDSNIITELVKQGRIL
ncbi:hypothetical protein [Butyrivibrio sp. FCS006]|uniref:hypothetical protein n=1 Tax=Butyrivibrio sp. FCS006 TaxID=1280684 RepID=UPI000424AEE6|nr:hypothetical protein [Butyrivibrio sp. FCS006]